MSYRLLLLYCLLLCEEYMSDKEKFMLLIAAVQRIVELNCVNVTGLLILLPVLTDINAAKR
jgi:hypothetical protein